MAPARTRPAAAQAAAQAQAPAQAREQACPAPDGADGACRRWEAPRSAGAALAARARRFRAADEAMAAIEFGLILPLLLTILLGGTQLVQYIDATRKVDLIARSVSQMISQAMPPPNAVAASVNAADLHFSFDAAMILFPSLLKGPTYKGSDWWQNITINYAGIQFTQVSATCTNSTDLSACYRADVVWTSLGVFWGPAAASYRPCSPAQVPADDTAPPSPTTLPRSIFGPTSLVVVDVVFTFTPSFGTRFIQPVRIARSAYVQPRYATLVTYDTANNDGIAARCPGY